MSRHLCAVAIVLGLSGTRLCQAWDSNGHRVITYLALDGMDDAPDWVKDELVRRRIAFEASQPDRWKSSPSHQLNHQNRPDHYLDMELLDQFGLTLETVPKLRYEYLRALAIAKYVHPEAVDRYDAGRDPDRTHEWPGFLLHAIAEHYAKLQCDFGQVQILEQVREPRRAYQLQQARENAIVEMGLLSHFVGDCAQPLHTTRHFNGWAGDNPNGYTTSPRLHAYVDDRLLPLHHVSYASMKDQVHRDWNITSDDPWDDVLKYFRKSFEQVEPLYVMERDKELPSEAGGKLIRERVLDAADMLAALYSAGYRSAAPTPRQISEWKTYEGSDPQAFTHEAPASAPAAIDPD